MPTAKDFLTYVIEPTLGWMTNKFPHPAPYYTPEAAMGLLAIALQETALDYRAQLGDGPARSFYQFEQGNEANGLIGLLLSEKAHPTAYEMTTMLGYKWNFDYLYKAIEFADDLATVYARLLLHTDPRQLKVDEEWMWQIYYDCWRPGKPSRDRWKTSWRTAVNTFVGVATA